MKRASINKPNLTLFLTRPSMQQYYIQKTCLQPMASLESLRLLRHSVEKKRATV